ncbi:MAG: TAXI family TRAP transporter solute-binding subunit [Alphaproteobacteria bacterium]|nr:TAXI family TRAP transporter solute-binding subunit [Alphaproteobacteria bacterium]
MKIIRNAAIAAVAAVALGAGAAKAQTFEFVAGSLGGGWYTMAAGLSAIVQEKVQGVTLRVVPGGGRDNPTRLQNNISQFGFGLDFLTQSATKGEDPYRARHDKIAHLGVGWSPTHFHLLRHTSGPTDMKSVFTQRGLRIGTVPVSSSDALVMFHAMRHYGVTADTIRQNGGRLVHASYADLVNAYIDGQVDYVWVALALPAAMVTEISQGRRAATLVPFDADLRNHLSSTYGLSQGPIPANFYQRLNHPEIPATTMDTVLLVSNSVPEQVVYNVLKTLVENRSRFGAIHVSMNAFNPSVAWRYSGAPLHPAAQRVYRELGFMN